MVYYTIIPIILLIVIICSCVSSVISVALLNLISHASDILDKNMNDKFDNESEKYLMILPKF